MRITTITTGLLAAFMLLPASASAIVGQYGDYPAPTGSICKDGNCFDVATAGRIKEEIIVNGDFEIVHRKYERWLFNDIPEEDKDSFGVMQGATYNEYRREGLIVSTETSVSKAVTQDVAAYCNRFRDYKAMDAGMGYTAYDRTPDSVFNACKFTRRSSDPVPVTPAPPTPAVETSIVVPGSAARCGAVRGSDGRVAVRSSRHSCGVARSVVARYARALRSPAGWTCEATVKDDAMRARCTRKTSGRAAARSAVYGVWVRG